MGIHMRKFVSMKAFGFALAMILIISTAAKPQAQNSPITPTPSAADSDETRVYSVARGNISS
jgi:hypothetical protein